MEEKRKEVEKEADKSKKDQRKNYDEVDGSKKDHSPEDDGGDGTQETTGGATDPTDSFHPKEECITSVQEAGMQLLTSMELDDEAEVETENDVKSSKEMDVEAEDGSTGQGTGHYFKKKESGEESGEKDEVEAAKKNNRQEYASG